MDIAYLNLGGTFYYLCSLLDGYSRAIVHWEVREAMKESDVELIIQQALEKYPGVTPRIISDNGPQFIARDFKDFIRLSGLTHVRTAPFYPQSKENVAYCTSIEQSEPKGSTVKESLGGKPPRLTWLAAAG